MDKLPLFYKFTDFNVMYDMGGQIIGRFRNYFPPWGQIMVEWGAFVVIINSFHISLPTWIVPVILIGKFYFWIFAYYVGGKFARKVGLLKAQSQYMAREKEINPWTVEATATLSNIASAVGAKSEFSKYTGTLKEIPKEFKE